MKLFLFLSLFIYFLAVQCARLKAPSWKHCIHNMRTLGKWQEFSSPGFPHGISVQTQCSWIITSSPNQRIKLSFYALNLTGSIDYCFTQSVIIYELNNGRKMATLCGKQRPGDYISYGNQIRIDLHADTATPGHQGFLFKYKSTREASGFKAKLSFPLSTSNVKDTTLQSSTSGRPKAKPTSSPARLHGGRINLLSLRNQREKARRLLSSASRGKSNETRQPVHRHIPRRSTLKQSFVQQHDSAIVIHEDRDDNVSVKVETLVGICIGGFLFILCSIVLYWYYCHKQQKKTIDDSTTPAMKIRVNLPIHPSHKHHNLPAIVTSQSLRSQRRHWVNENSSINAHRSASFALPRRASRSNYMTSLNQQKFGLRNNGDLNYVINKDSAICNMSSYKNRRYFYPPVGFDKFPTMTSSSTADTDKSEDWRAAVFKDETKQIPTLKRKLSEWEKQEIQKNKLKM